MNENTPITPEEMKKWRERNGFSGAQAARRAGVDRSTWSKWERGIARPTAENEVQLRSVMYDAEYSQHSSRTREVFDPLLDEELFNFLLHANLESITGAPMVLKTGPRRCDRRMENLALWFERYFKSQSDAEAILRTDKGTFFYDIQINATYAGYCVGSFKYAVTEDAAEEWYQAAEALFVDLMGMKRIFEQNDPKKAAQLWPEAFQRFLDGYALAVERTCWRDSAWYELFILAAMLFDAKNISMVRSVISAEDFAEPQHRFLFNALVDLLDQGKPIAANTIEAKLKEIAPPGTMDKSRWSWPVQAELIYATGVVKGRGIACDPNDLMDWVMEVKGRSLSRTLMDRCRKVAASLEEGLHLEKDLEELERMMPQLKSFSEHRKTRHEDR